MQALEETEDTGHETKARTTNMKQCIWADEIEKEGGILPIRKKWGGIGRYLY